MSNKYYAVLLQDTPPVSLAQATADATMLIGDDTSKVAYVVVATRKVQWKVDVTDIVDL